QIRPVPPGSRVKSLVSLPEPRNASPSGNVVVQFVGGWAAKLEPAVPVAPLPAVPRPYSEKTAAVAAATTTTARIAASAAFFMVPAPLRQNIIMLQEGVAIFT